MMPTRQAVTTSQAKGSHKRRENVKLTEGVVDMSRYCSQASKIGLEPWLKYTRKNGTVRVELYQEGKHAQRLGQVIVDPSTTIEDLAAHRVVKKAVEKWHAGRNWLPAFILDIRDEDPQ